MPTIAQTEFVASLYIGYFNRAPDPAGFMFWLGVVDAQAEALGAESPAFYKFLTEDLPQFFAENPEPRSVYPFLEAPSPESAEDFLTSVYQNLFGRNPDKAGLAFYRDALLVPELHLQPAPGPRGGGPGGAAAVLGDAQGAGAGAAGAADCGRGQQARARRGGWRG